MKENNGLRTLHQVGNVVTPQFFNEIAETRVSGKRTGKGALAPRGIEILTGGSGIASVVVAPGQYE